jgi:hypothetical protein
MCHPTVCVTGAGVGVDSVWEQRKLEARKLLINRAESLASSARGVGRFYFAARALYSISISNFKTEPNAFRVK